ncbi:hypothetical protein BDN72DRAFT_844618 [Pluteus cervinus]|uniref:Uncharacterized protein n=1 Tax=Pluteus cervinus TaxID=181527 RepID=A0ACD3AKT5_9AGAR|nr:hypothetical protein BDN72DRAFT_844618 [Pluteus cervinus]
MALHPDLARNDYGRYLLLSRCHRLQDSSDLHTPVGYVELAGPLAIQNMCEVPSR